VVKMTMSQVDVLSILFDTFDRVRPEVSNNIDKEHKAAGYGSQHSCKHSKSRSHKAIS